MKPAAASSSSSGLELFQSDQSQELSHSSFLKLTLRLLQLQGLLDQLLGPVLARFHPSGCTSVCAASPMSGESLAI